MTPKSLVPVSPRLFQVNRLFWFSIGMVVIFDAIYLYFTGIKIDLTPVYGFWWLIALNIAIIFTHGILHRDDNLYLFAHALNQLIVAAPALSLLGYLSAAWNFPLRDKSFIEMDSWLGFDWRSHIAWMDTQPLLSWILSFSYSSFSLQVMLLIFLLFMCKHAAHAQRFLIAFLTTAFLTIMLAAFFPAVGGYVYYDIDIDNFHHLQPAAARIHEVALLGMRSHSLHILAFPLIGLVTFPSFHAAAALLFIYGALPLRPLLILLAPLNVAMFFSTLSNGGHYLIDVLAGAIIAFICILMAEKKYRAKKLRFLNI